MQLFPLQVQEDSLENKEITSHLSLNNLVRSPFPSSSSQQIVVASRGPVSGSLEALYSTKRMISRTAHFDRQPELRVMNASLFMYDAQGNKLDHNFDPLPPGTTIVNDFIII